MGAGSLRTGGAELALAVTFGLTIEDNTSTIHPYLAFSGGINLAARAFDKHAGKLSRCGA